MLAKSEEGLAILRLVALGDPNAWAVVHLALPTLWRNTETAFQTSRHLHGHGPMPAGFDRDNGPHPADGWTAHPNLGSIASMGIAIAEARMAKDAQAQAEAQAPQAQAPQAQAQAPEAPEAPQAPEAQADAPAPAKRTPPTRKGKGKNKGK
jgi:hypothetical protein